MSDHHARNVPIRALAIFVAVAAIMSLAAPAWAPPLKKEFTACGGVAPACAAPATVPSGSSVPITIVITKTRNGPALGSADLILPAELLVVSVADPVVPAGKDWTASASGQTVQLRNPGEGSENQLVSGQSVAVTITVDAACIPPRAPVDITAKPTNDFSGTTTLIGDDLPYFIGCNPPGATHLAFGQQPTDSISAAAITPAVTVRVEDASNNLVTSFSGTVSLSLGSNPGGSSLFGADPVTVSGGIATFPDLAVIQAATGTVSGYTLVATSSPALTSATSSAFAVTGQSAFCEFVTCTASSGNFNNVSASETWIGRVSIDTGDCPDESCFVTAYEENTCPEGFDCKTDMFVFIPPVNEQGLIQVQIICHSSVCPNTGPPGGTDPVFKQLENGTVIELHRCHNAPPSGEDLVQGCITEIIRNRPGHTIYSIVLPAAGDPKMFK